MVRRFDLTLPSGKKINCFLQKFTWADQYGVRGRSYSSLNEEPLSLVKITQDGKHILPNKSMSQMYIDAEGNEVSKSEIFQVNQDGEFLPIHPSIFDKEGASITETISIQDYFCYDIFTTYILQSDSDTAELDLDHTYKECSTLYKQGELYTFSFAYYETPDPQVAILIPTLDERILIAIGNHTEPVFNGPKSNIDEYELLELEEQETNEFDFESAW